MNFVFPNKIDIGIKKVVKDKIQTVLTILTVSDTQKVLTKAFFGKIEDIDDNIKNINTAKLTTIGGWKKEFDILLIIAVVITGKKSIPNGL